MSFSPVVSQLQPVELRPAHRMATLFLMTFSTQKQAMGIGPTLFSILLVGVSWDSSHRLALTAVASRAKSDMSGTAPT